MNRQFRRRLSISVLISVGALTMGLRILAAGGDLDPTFGGTGKVMASTGSAVLISATVVQPDGKIIVVGHNNQLGESALVARFHPNGSLDLSFGTGGIVTDNAHGLHDSYLTAVAIVGSPGTELEFAL